MWWIIDTVIALLWALLIWAWARRRFRKRPKIRF
jgi:hypothetical protein